jgi:hypothetical protein
VLGDVGRRTVSVAKEGRGVGGRACHHPMRSLTELPGRDDEAGGGHSGRAEAMHVGWGYDEVGEGTVN